MNYKEYHRLIEQLDRRAFLKRLAKGLTAAVNIPWTKLLSTPELAKTVTAPFKIGAGTILNPQDLHWYYVRKFANKAVESGLTPVDVTDERHYDEPVNEISFEAFEWVSKNIINMYVDDVGHSTDREGSTVAPTLHELISMGEEKEDFIDDPNFPEWAKPLLAKDEDDLTEEEREKYNELMNSKWFDKQMVINWDGEWGHGADEEIQEMLGNWTGWHHNNPQWKPGDELINTLFDYIVDLNRTRNDEGKFMDINEIMKMDFKQEFLPGVAKYAREIAIARQTRSSGNQQKQAEPDTDIHQGRGRPSSRQDVPNKVKATGNEEEWTEENKQWWNDRFHVIDTVTGRISKDIYDYIEFADNILKRKPEGRIAGDDEHPSYDLLQQAEDYRSWIQKYYVNKGNPAERPSNVSDRNPIGVGRPQSGLQTASTKPTFKEFLNNKY